MACIFPRQRRFPEDFAERVIDLAMEAGEMCVIGGLPPG
jgi:hypothetical protein